MIRAKIVVKLTLWIALLSILSASVSVYYSYTNSRDLLIKSAKEKLITATQVLANRYSFFIDDIAKDLVFISKLPALEEIVDGQNKQSIKQQKERLGGALSKFLLAHMEYTQVRFIGTQDHGRELVRVDKTTGHTLMVKGLALQEKGHFSYVFNTLKLKPGEIYISSIRLNKERGARSDFGKPTLIAATPVFTESNRLSGLIVINVDLEQMFSLIQTDVSSDIDVIATNAEGDYLIHPDKVKTFGFDKGTRYLIQQDLKASQRIFSGEAAQLSEEITDFSDPTKRAIISLKKIPFNTPAEQKYIVIGLITKLDTTLAESRQLGLNNLKISLGFSCLLILISFLLARTISRPLQLMAKTFENFQDGDALPELPVNTNDELGVLARNFTSMAKKLNAQFDELRNQRRILHRVAHHDALTGLPNRILLEDRMNQAIIKARRDKTEVAVMLVDLDNFKPVNDLYGHDVGDKLLQQVALKMLTAVREVDTVARIGGDEFMIIISSRDQHLTNMDLRLISRQIAEKIRAQLSQPLHIQHHQINISCSIGIALHPQDGSTIDSLTKHADQAMYYAKSAGKNIIKHYSDILS